MQTCESILVHILNKDSRALEEAGDHIAGCALCRKRLSTLLSDIRSDQPDLMPCAECRALLPELVTATPSEISTNPYLLAAQSHVQSCEACRQECDQLRTVVDVIPLARRIANKVRRTRVTMPSQTRPGAYAYLRGSALSRASDVARSPGTPKRSEKNIDFRPELDIILALSYVKQDTHYIVRATPLFAKSGQPALGTYLELYVGDALSLSFYIEDSQRTATLENIIPGTGYTFRVECRGKESTRVLEFPEETT
jgi:hypothetical protein